MTALAVWLGLGTAAAAVACGGSGNGAPLARDGGGPSTVTDSGTALDSGGAPEGSAARDGTSPVDAGAPKESGPPIEIDGGLPTVAAAMPPGSWAKLDTNGFANGDVFRPIDHGSILEYTDKAGAWDPAAGVALILGGSHPGTHTGPCNTTLFVSYTAATNTFANNLNSGLASPCPNYDTSFCSTFCNVGHAYQHQAVDAAGNFYHRQYYSGNVMVFGHASQAWSQCTPYTTGPVQVAGALEYFPDRNSLVMVDGDWGVWELSLASGGCTGSWTQVAATNGASSVTPKLPMTSYNNKAIYSPACKCVVLGGGLAMYAYQADGSWTTNLGAPPLALSTPQNDGTPADNGCILTADPAGGLILAWDGSTDGTAFQYDPTSDTWTKTGIVAPLFPGPEGGVTETTASRIPTYGVLMFVQAGSASGGGVYLYKHTG